MVGLREALLGGGAKGGLIRGWGRGWVFTYKDPWYRTLHHSHSF